MLENALGRGSRTSHEALGLQVSLGGVAVAAEGVAICGSGPRQQMGQGHDWHVVGSF